MTWGKGLKDLHLEDCISDTHPTAKRVISDRESLWGSLSVIHLRVNLEMVKKTAVLFEALKESPSRTVISDKNALMGLFSLKPVNLLTPNY